MRGAAAMHSHGLERRFTMVDRRIKPFKQQQAEKAAREEQARVFRRNQVFGLLIVAAAIVAWWLWHTNPKWIFPQGWWRL
jgi:ferric-dicitrate binding protein FerR (iron transport regulator)